MGFIVDNNFDDVLSSLMKESKANAYILNRSCVSTAELNGHKVECRADRRIVKGCWTLVCTWIFDGRRSGLNAVRCKLRKE